MLLTNPHFAILVAGYRLTDYHHLVKSLEGCHGPHYSVREIFVKARQMAPCLLVFEDLDSLITDKVKSFFLNEVDGLESNDGIMMIGSTNYRMSPLSHYPALVPPT